MRVVMTTGRLSARSAVTLVLIAAVTAIGTWAVPTGAGQRVFTDAAQCVTGVIAALICFTAGRERTGPRRRWRLLLGAGLAGFAAIRLWWTVADIVDPARPVAGRLTDIGFLILPIFAVLALIAGSTALPRPVQASPDPSPCDWTISSSPRPLPSEACF